MADEDMKKQILALLAREWDASGPPGILDISDVVSIIPDAPSQIMDQIKDLFSDGLIDMNFLKTSIFLTPEGYDIIHPE